MSPTGQHRTQEQSRATPTRLEPRRAPPAKMPPRKMWLWSCWSWLQNFLAGEADGARPEAPVRALYLFKEEVRRATSSRSTAGATSITGRFKRGRLPAAGDKRAAPKKADPVDGDRGRRRQPPKRRLFATTLPSFVDPGLESLPDRSRVEISAKPIEKAAAPGDAPVRIRSALLSSLLLLSSAVSAGGVMGGGPHGHRQEQRRVATTRSRQKITSTTSPASTG